MSTNTTQETTKTPHFARDLFYESRLHTFCQEASTLGLKPGEWPQKFDSDLGNGQRFILDHVDNDGSHIYHQLMGCIRVIIWND